MEDPLHHKQPEMRKYRYYHPNKWYMEKATDVLTSQWWLKGKTKHIIIIIII
jgi:hypothetical protein